MQNFALLKSPFLLQKGKKLYEKMVENIDNDYNTSKTEE